MTHEAIVKAFMNQGRRQCMDYLIEAHRGQAQSVNLQGLMMTDLELAEWCAGVAEEVTDQLTTA